MKREDIVEEIKTFTCEQFGASSALAHESSKLKEDIGLDSLDVVELVMHVEKTYDIAIPDEFCDDKDITIGQLADEAIRVLSASGRTSS